jgi:hypothetical protein
MTVYGAEHFPPNQSCLLPSQLSSHTGGNSQMMPINAKIDLHSSRGSNIEL